MKTLVQKGTPQKSIWDTVKLNWGRSKIEFYYVPNYAYDNSSFPVYS